MARRARTSRRDQPSSSAHISSSYIRRGLAYFDPLQEEELVRIERHVDWILENVGFAFRDDPEAHRRWREAGIKLTGDDFDIVKADAKWVRELCAKAPSEFTQLARNRDRNVIIGGRNQVFAPV